MEVVQKRHQVAIRLWEALKEEVKMEKDLVTSKPVLHVDALERARLIEVQ